MKGMIVMATARQINYILMLQDKTGKNEYTREQLKSFDVSEASLVISGLKNVSQTQPKPISDSKATPKQVEYVMKLQDKVKERHYKRKQIEDMNKKEINEAIQFLKFRFQELL